MSAIEGIGQIAITTDNLKRSKQFYTQVLGLPLLFDVGEHLSFLQCGDIRLMLTTLQGDKAEHHTSVIYYKVADIEQMFINLNAKQVVIEREPALAATLDDHQLWLGFIRDPDNHLVGIMAEKPLKYGA
ncbi:VOC family protein [Thalassotalea maritima]|uniref:VOC family protein n=1 Tax=Thalassotalea maritima TaxID=3242416 RepID=UPI003528E555